MNDLLNGIDNTPVFKRCTKCNKEKPITDFNKHKRYKSGYRSDCKRIGLKKTENIIVL